MVVYEMFDVLKFSMEQLISMELESPKIDRLAKCCIHLVYQS